MIEIGEMILRIAVGGLLGALIGLERHLRAKEAGLIIFHKNSVRGLTTAAGIWVVSAIGLASGAGMFWLGGTAAVMAVICLEAMHFFLRRFEQHQIRVSFSTDSEDTLQNALQRFGHELQFYTMERHPERIDATVILQVTSREYTGKILETGRSIPGITVTKIEPVED